MEATTTGNQMLKDMNDNKVCSSLPHNGFVKDENDERGKFIKTMLKDMNGRKKTNSNSNDEFYDAEEFIRHSRASSISTSSLKKFICHEKSNLDKGRLSDSLHSYSFAPSPTRHNVTGLSPSPQKDQTLNSSWKFYNFVGVDENEAVYNGSNRKSNEAVLTINAKTSRILVVNQTACRLFNYKEEELCGKKVYDLFTMEDGIKQEILIERNIDTNGNIVMASGKILEGVDSDGNVFIVSVWMKRIKSGDDARCVVIMEPVDVTKGSFLFDAEGMVKDCDFPFALLHGYEDPQEVVGTHIHKYIPALLLPSPGKTMEKNIRKQLATSRTKDSVPFPSTIKLKVHDPDFHELYMERTNPSQVHHSKLLYKGFIWVFANVSGLATVTNDGLITSCNSNFLRTFLGYTEAELLDKSITSVIPYFYEQIELLCEDSIPVHTPIGENTDDLHKKTDTFLSSEEYESPRPGPRMKKDMAIMGELMSSEEYESPGHEQLIENNLQSVDDFVKVNSSGSTLSDANSLQSASTLEEIEIVNEKLTSVDSGFGSRNVITSENNIYVSESKEINLDILDFEEPFQNELVDYDNTDLNDGAYDKNKKRTVSGCNSNKAFHSRIIQSSASSDRSKSEDTSLDGFSPHIQSSTPKTKTKSEHTFNTDDIALNENIPFNLKKEVWTSESSSDNEIIASTCKTNGVGLDNDKIDYASCSKGYVISTRTCDTVGKDVKLMPEPLLCSPVTKDKFKVNTKKLSEYAIGTSEYGSLGSPLSEIEFNNNEIDNVDVFIADKIADESSASHYSPDHQLIIKDNISCSKETNGDDYEQSSDSSSCNKKKLKDPQIDNFMREMNLNDEGNRRPYLCKAFEELELSPKREKSSKIVQGFYYGQAKHKDGSLLPVLFEIKKIYLKDKEEVFCIWISKDPDEDSEYSRKPETRSLLSSLNSTVNTSTGNCQELINSMKDLNVEDPGRGLYNERFVNVRCVGKGAFGFVNLAERKANREQVIVKFIRKEKVLKDSWVSDDIVGRIPFEVYLLAQIQHPFIVKMLEAYENEEYFQMVMEKHGDGIDLFEFIDRKPQMDEALASYMYRQVLSATEYLHGEKILHRDIKDENIIVDRQFNIKLIDFGSAIYMEEGKLFNTFCGTVEYCSPEVLLGNWYEGPELEMWSLGVTLYTFIFGEHPFFEVEETIQAELFPPFKVSNELMFVIYWMLNPDVNSRARLKDLVSYPWFTRHVDIKKYDYDAVLGLNGETNNEILSPSNGRSSEDLKKHARERQLSGEEYLHCTKCSSSGSSLSSSSSNSSLSDGGESNTQNELLREKYKSFLGDPLDLRTDDILSKSF